MTTALVFAAAVAEWRIAHHEPDGSTAYSAELYTMAEAWAEQRRLNAQGEVVYWLKLNQEAN